jgi:ribosomal protein L7/L12
MDGVQALILMLALIVVGLSLQVRMLSGRVKRLERGFEFGSIPAQPNQFAVPAQPSDAPASTPGQASPAVLAFIDAGQKIGAIKQYRNETGAGLREAKDAVEEFERRRLNINA